jgi:hypothetical protein
MFTKEEDRNELCQFTDLEAAKGEFEEELGFKADGASINSRHGKVARQYVPPTIRVPRGNRATTATSALSSAAFH